MGSWGRYWFWPAALLDLAAEIRTGLDQKASTRSHMHHREEHMLCRVGLSMAMLGALLGTPTHAQDFYRGKTLTLVIGNTAGSGYDTYGRLIARQMAKHLPGTPNVVPQNMPGAGSVKAADYMYMIAPKDGTHLGLVMPGALVDPLANTAVKYRYEPSKFEFIGTADSSAKLCFGLELSPVKSIEEAQQTKAIVASGPRADYPLMLNALLKTKFQIVTGYPGPSEQLMALERGEGDLICGLDLTAVNTLRPGLLQSGKAKILVHFGFGPRPLLTSLGVPDIWKFISEQDRPLVELIAAEQQFQRPFIAPPGTPAARVAELRAAFDAVMRDPDFLGEAKKSNLEINPMTGTEVAAALERVYAAPKVLVDRMSKVSR